MGNVSRRRFLAFLPATVGAVGALAWPARLDAIAGLGGHPEPRPDVDGSTVLAAEDLVGTPHVIDLFDGVRQIPQIVDGIRCYCGCADLPRTRSLLSCYEEGGAARYCAICQGEGRLAVRRSREGQSLDEIRRAVDARFGSQARATIAERARGRSAAGSEAHGAGAHGMHHDGP